MLQITGRLIKTLPVEQGTSKAGKTYTKGGFAIETGDEYPKKILFDLMGERVAIIQPFPIGSMITVNFSIESRETSTGKWFTSCRAISVMPAQQPTYAAAGYMPQAQGYQPMPQSMQQPPQPYQPAPQQPVQPGMPIHPKGDLPF